MGTYWGKRGKKSSHHTGDKKSGSAFSKRGQKPSPKGELLKEELKNTKSASKSEKLLPFIVVPICLVILFFMKQQEKNNYPKLLAFGWTEWSVKCQGEGRDYYLVSDINVNEETVGGRHLKFLDQKGQALYYTPLFEKESLDQDSVWRFNYHPKDVRLFVKKDRTKVLKGDEKVFEIAEDFKTLTVITQTGDRLILACQRLNADL